MEIRSASEALNAQLKGALAVHVRGTNWEKNANHIIAKNILDKDLGRFSDPVPNYSIEPETRDRLLIHARQDAAEALLQARSLIDEAHKFRDSVKTLTANLWVAVLIILITQHWDAIYTLFNRLK